MMGDFQKQGKGELGDGIGAVGRDVANRNTLFFRRLGIDYIVAGGEHPDIFDVGSLLYNLPAQWSLVGDDDIGITDTRENILFLGSIVDGQGPKLGKAVPTQVSRVFGIAIKNNNGVLHGSSFTMVSPNCSTKGQEKSAYTLSAIRCFRFSLIPSLPRRMRLIASSRTAGLACFMMYPFAPLAMARSP